MKKITLTSLIILMITLIGVVLASPVKAAETDKVTIPDEGLRQVLADTLNSMNSHNKAWVTKDKTSDFTKAELETITSIDFDRSTAVKDLTGLEYCTNVEYIDLELCKNVSNLTPLKNLKKIKSLDIEQINWDKENKATNLTVLSGLTNMETIRINHSNLSDADVWIFDNMNKLKMLETGMNNISDTKFLLKHKNTLETVNLTGTEISKIDDLLQLSNVKILCISDTHISDFSFISKLPKLTNTSTRWAQWGEADFSTTNYNDRYEVFGNGETVSIKNTAKDSNGNLWAPETSNCTYNASTGMITINKNNLEGGRIKIKYNANWNKNGSTYSVEYTETIYFEDLYFSKEPIDATVNENEKITLDSYARCMNEYSDNKINYQWYKDGNVIEGATSKTYSVTAASLKDAGKYYVVALNGYSRIQSKEITVVVNVNEPEKPADEPEKPADEPVEEPEAPADEPEVPAEEPEEPTEEPEVPAKEPEEIVISEEVKINENPKTGDSIIFSIGLLVIAYIAIIAISIKRK